MQIPFSLLFPFNESHPFHNCHCSNCSTIGSSFPLLPLLPSPSLPLLRYPPFPPLPLLPSPSLPLSLPYPFLSYPSPLNSPASKQDSWIAIDATTGDKLYSFSSNNGMEDVCGIDEDQTPNNVLHIPQTGEDNS